MLLTFAGAISHNRRHVVVVYREINAYHGSRRAAMSVEILDTALGFVSSSIYVVYRFHFTVKASVKTITSVSKLITCYMVIKSFSWAIFWFSYKNSILIELTKKISLNLIIYLPCTILHWWFWTHSGLRRIFATLKSSRYW